MMSCTPNFQSYTMEYNDNVEPPVPDFPFDFEDNQKQKSSESDVPKSEPANQRSLPDKELPLDTNSQTTRFRVSAEQFFKNWLEEYAKTLSNNEHTTQVRYNTSQEQASVSEPIPQSDVPPAKPTETVSEQFNYSFSFRRSVPPPQPGHSPFDPYSIDGYDDPNLTFYRHRRNGQPELMPHLSDELLLRFEIMYKEKWDLPTEMYMERSVIIERYLRWIANNPNVKTIL